MLDIKLIRENPESVRQNLARRGGEHQIDKILELDMQRLESIKKTESLKRDRNEKTKLIGARKKAGEDTAEIQEQTRKLSEKAKQLETGLKNIESDIRTTLLMTPNLCHDSVPDGAEEADNVEVRKWGEVPEFSFKPKSHVELGADSGTMDFARAAKIAGARFSILSGAAAQMERALISFMLDIHTTEHGYTEIAPPFMVNSDAMLGTGQLPKFREDQFKIENSDYWLIPTAEVPLTNIYSGEILSAAALPLFLTAYTPCFRAEAGSYGKDTTGLIRQHQFSKVEMVKIVTPDQGEAELEKLTGNAEEILQRLGLPYRVVNLCAGDLGISSTKTYDLEVWVPSQNKYREISSCSLFTDYQARRLNLRYRKEEKSKPEFVYTINGSGLAVGRTIVAIFENYQREDGSIEIPEALRPYMRGLEEIRL